MVARCLHFICAQSDTNKNVLPLMELPHFPWSLLNLNNDEIIFNIADVQANGGGINPITVQ